MHGAPIHVGDPIAVGHFRSGSARLRRSRDDQARRSAGVLGLWRHAASRLARGQSGNRHHPQPRLHVRHRFARGVDFARHEYHNGACQPEALRRRRLPPAVSRARPIVRRARGRVLRWPGGQPGAAARHRRHRRLHDRPCNANHGGVFATSRTSDAMLATAHAAVADLLGSRRSAFDRLRREHDHAHVCLQPGLGRTWRPGDEVLVTRLDHDANVTPWVLAARDAGAVVQHVDVRPGDCTLDLDDLKRKLSPAHAAGGSRLLPRTPWARSIPWPRSAAWSTRPAGRCSVDAVHYAPHGRSTCEAWDCDFLACSAYKFFGPHVGVLWGRRELLAELPAYKVRPAPRRTARAAG